MQIESLLFDLKLNAKGKKNWFKLWGKIIDQENTFKGDPKN